MLGAAATLNLHNSPLVRDTFGVQVDAKPLSVVARRLPSPRILYANDEAIVINERDNTWTAGQVIEGSNSRVWRIYVLADKDETSMLTPHALDAIRRRLFEAANSAGVRVETIENSGFHPVAELANSIKACRDGNVNLCIILTSDDRLHGESKRQFFIQRAIFIF